MADPYNFKKLQTNHYHTFRWQKLASITYHWLPSILQNCEDLTSLILIANFQDEEMPANVDLLFYNLKNLVLAYLQTKRSNSIMVKQLNQIAAIGSIMESIGRIQS